MERDAHDEVEETRPHYHPIGITFHWLMAALVFFQIGWGWWSSLSPAGYEKLEAYAVHALAGLLLLVLAFLRAGWRSIAPFVLPELEKPEDLPGWQKRAAELTHLALYLLMFALPISGWLMLSAASSGQGVALPFAATAPALPFTGNLDFVERAHLERAAERTHLILVWMLMFLTAAHVGAALKHQFIDRDDVLARMIPWLSPRESSPNESATSAANAAR